MQMFILLIQLIFEALIMSIIPDYKSMFGYNDADADEALHPTHSS